MKISTITSGNKGGTGKTTISLLLTLASNYAGIPALHIDTSSEGGAGTILLGAKPGPYLRDFFEGRASILESINIYTLELGDEEFDFYILLNSGCLPKIRLESFFTCLRSLERYFELVIIDLPAYQDLWYEQFSMLSDVVVKVTEPSPASLTAVFSAWPRLNDEASIDVIYVLNQPRFYSMSVVKLYEERLKQSVGEERVVVIPYDYAASRLAPENIEVALLNLSEKFQDALITLTQKLLRPKVKIKT